MTKLEETNKLIKSYNDCMLKLTEKVLLDMAKSLAIIADKLCDIESEDKKK